MEVEEKTKEQLIKEIEVLRQEIAALKTSQNQEQIQYHLTREEAIAKASRLLISSTEVDLYDILEIIGEAFSVNRAYILQFQKNRMKMHNTHKWCAPKTEPQIGNHLQDLDINIFPWLMKKLECGEDIVIPDVNGLPPDAAVEKKIIQAQAIRSLLCTPLYSPDGTLKGFLEIDDTEKCRNWVSLEVQAGLNPTFVTPTAIRIRAV